MISYLGSPVGSPDGTTAPGVYNGNAAGIWDPSSGSISGQFWGGYTLAGTNSAIIYPQIYNTNEYPVPINVLSNQTLQTTITDPTTGVTTQITTNIVTTNTIYVEPVGSNVFKNSVFMNGTFDGSVQNKYPNQTFSAQGSISQQQLSPPQQGITTNITANNDGTFTTNITTNTPGTTPVQMAETLTIPVSVQGIRVSDTYSTFNLISNAIPYSITTYSVTNVTSLQQGQ